MSLSSTPRYSVIDGKIEFTCDSCSKVHQIEVIQRQNYGAHYAENLTSSHMVLISGILNNLLKYEKFTVNQLVDDFENITPNGFTKFGKQRIHSLSSELKALKIFKVVETEKRISKTKSRSEIYKLDISRINELSEVLNWLLNEFG